MQIRAYILLLIFCGAAAAAAENLCPEWENPLTTPNGVRLAKWRFSEWGVRQDPRKKIIRSARTALIDGKPAVTLESSNALNSANILFRTVPLKAGNSGKFRLSLTAVNASSRKALLKINFSTPGKKPFSAAHYAAVSEKPEEKSFSVKLPSGSRSVIVSVGLYGPGKITLSELRLEEEPQESPVHLSPVVPAEIFRIPERMPVEFPIVLPPGLALSAGDALRITLPWGIRFINCSARGAVIRVSLQVGENSVIKLSPSAGKTLSGKLCLLLGSDLPVSENIFSGSVEVEKKGGRGEEHFFRVQTVKEIQAVPPRFFRIALSVSENIPPLESAPERNNGLLRSGANLFVANYLNFPWRTLRNARIDHYAEWNIWPAKAARHCYYEQLRNESFWEKTFLPNLRRNILRYGNKNISGIICDSYLGQKRAINCLCSLCRAELADFAPKLPLRNVMNYSAGLLSIRFKKELLAFRKARLHALREGAKLYLPVGSSGFSRKPVLVYSHNFHSLPAAHTLPETPVNLIDFQQGFQVPDGKKYNSAVNFLAKKHYLDHFRKTNRGRQLLTALAVRPSTMTPEQLKFEIFNMLAAGANGVWIKLPMGTSYRYRSAIAESSFLLREYENFFRRGPVSAKNWQLTTEFPALEIPPVPGAGSFPLPLPEKFPALKLLIWRSGKNTLAGVGNFASVPVRACLQNSAADKKWNGSVNGRMISGAILKERGISLTFPAHSWSFFEFRGL